MSNLAQTINSGLSRMYKLGATGPINVILILPDDEGYGQMGTGTLRTTGVANLVTRGVNFRNYRGVVSLCEPSRVSEMTGQYQQNNGVISNNTDLSGPGFFPDLQERFFYALAQGAANDREYQTAHIGKWIGPQYEIAWNGENTAYGVGGALMPTIGLDEARIITSCPPSAYGFTGAEYVPICTVKRNWQAVERSYDASGNQIGADSYYPALPTPGLASPYPYSVDYIADQTLKIIDLFMSRPVGDPRRGLPFFINCWPQAPHYPVTNPQNQLPLTTADGAPPWAVNRTARWNAYNTYVAPFWDFATYGNAPDVYSPGLRGNITLPVPSGTMTDERQRMQSLMAVDDMVDAIIAKLISYNILNNTLIVYASDNGFNRGEHGSWGGKDGFYDSGLRVPMVVAGPGFPAGVNCDAAVYNIDMVPTLLAATGLSPTWTLDNGWDLATVVANPSVVSDRVVSLAVGKSTVSDNIAYGAMTPRYKIFYSANQFFDLLNDPWENFNLYDGSTHALKTGNTPWGIPCSWYQEAFSTMQSMRVTMRQCAGSSCFQTFDGVPHP